MPVLLTQGDESPAWFPRDRRAARPPLVGHAEVRTYSGAGHAPHLTHPGDYVAAVTDFAAGSIRLAG
jgi:pimeloyl-ACP methyl ester carboxylesterase